MSFNFAETSVRLFPKALGAHNVDDLATLDTPTDGLAHAKLYDRKLSALSNLLCCWKHNESNSLGKELSSEKQDVT